MENAQPCTQGNESAAIVSLNACVSSIFPSLSQPCLAAFSSMGTGGGGGTPQGGGAGGGTGGGADGGGGCSTISMFVPMRTAGTFSTTVNTIAYAASSASDPTDVLSLELWWDSTPLPITRDLSMAGTRQGCLSCALLGRGCVLSTGQCSGGQYYGRSGTMTVSTAPRDMPGLFVGSISNVRFEEWDMTADIPVPNGRCVVVLSGGVSAQVQ